MGQPILLNELKEGLVLNQSLGTSGHVSTGSSSQEVLGSLYHPECFGQLGARQRAGITPLFLRDLSLDSVFIVLPVIVCR